MSAALKDSKTIPWIVFHSFMLRDMRSKNAIWAIEENGIWGGGSYFSLAESTCLACIKSKTIVGVYEAMYCRLHYKLLSPVCANGT